MQLWNCVIPTLDGLNMSSIPFHSTVTEIRECYVGKDAADPAPLLRCRRAELRHGHEAGPISASKAHRLPGSLVARSNAKNEAPAAAASKEDNAKHVQRITKWGPDLTLDPSVRKSRALAYQTRLVQITKELKSGTLEIGENEGSMSTARGSNSDDANNQKKNEQGKVELLELERREIIGEILHLNSGYKVPEDYKPLLKETKIPLLTKAHPGHNIIGVLMGLDSNAKKRLQQETGAKICVYGTKKANGEKTEIHQPDINEAQDAYEDLYINVSADSYDKLDAAITLIELLLTPASVNSTATEASATVSSEVSSGGANLADLQQVQSTTCPPGFLQYQSHNAHWVSTPQANVPSIPSSGSLPSALPNNTFQFQPPADSLSMPPYTVPPHVMNIMPRNPLPIHGPQPSMSNTQQPPPQFQANPSIGPPFGRPPGIGSPLLAPSSMLPRSIRPLQTPHVSGGWLNFSSVPVQPQRPPPTFMPVRPPISVSPLVSTPQLEGAVPPVPSQSNMSTSYGTQQPLGARFATSATLPSRPSGGPQFFPFSAASGPFLGANAVVSCWVTTAVISAVHANATSHANTYSNERPSFSFPPGSTFRIWYGRFCKHKLQSDINGWFQATTSSHR
ncbi:hypothetical protein GUJ93_ZPchr0008g13673 [Zizania palustris]|uniref:KHDC4/BBP-like KH-domain type I domain-containing protein n=1 Tax=Zizania palustris TaxID=103762 RepID=A0A8J5RJT6_ZIZPA|nr:hypothetical protein GUJ93_ZPchr0008g13673 [Zizania palustris]